MVDLKILKNRAIIFFAIAAVAVSAILFFIKSNSAVAEDPNQKFPYDPNKFDARLSVGQEGIRICRAFSRMGSSNLCEARRYCQEDAIAELNRRMAKLKPEDKLGRLNLLVKKAEVLTYQEDQLLDSLEAFTKAYNYALSFDKKRALNLLAKIGMIQMRLGEIKNCINNHNSDSCIFPLSKLAQHIDKTGSKKALDIFNKYLIERPDDDHIKWLVNILHMTLGTYPEGVPKERLINYNRMISEASFPGFKNIAPELGIGIYRNVGGAVADDFNNDGYTDLMFGSLYPCDSVIYYQFNPQTTQFEDRTKEAGLAGQNGVGLILQADFDNDGDLDVYLTRGSWHPGGAETPAWGGFSYNSLLKNDGAGKFEDITEASGVKGQPNSSLSANWADVNNDGWLDLYVSNESRAPDLFINRSGKFKNEIKSSGIINNALAKGSIFSDLNNDGNLDLIFTSLQGPKKVYIGKGDGTFVSAS